MIIYVCYWFLEVLTFSMFFGVKYVNILFQAADVLQECYSRFAVPANFLPSNSKVPHGQVDLPNKPLVGKCGDCILQSPTLFVGFHAKFTCSL